MTGAILQIVVQLVDLILAPAVREDAARFRAAVDRLVAALAPDLPAKEDGTPWTAADVQSAADAVIARNEAIQARLRRTSES